MIQARAACGLVAALLTVGCVLDEERHDVPQLLVGPDEVEPFERSPIFADVRELRVDHDGVWVLDRVQPFVTFVPLERDRDLVQFGRLGDGPSELREPVAIRLAQDGVEIWDVASNKRVSYSRDGSLVSVGTLDFRGSGWIRGDMTEVSHLDPWRVREAHGQVVFARFPTGMTHPLDYGRGSLVTTGLDLTTTDPIVSFAEHLPRDARALGQFPAMPLWDLCSDGTLLTWDARSGQVRWWEEGGRATRSAFVPSDGLRITLDGVERYLTLMARHELGPGFESAGIDFGRLARDARPAFGAFASPFVDLRCSLDGTAWLRRFDLEADPLGRGLTWLRVDPRRETSVRLPSDFDPFFYDRDGAVGLLTTSQGETLARWRRIDRTTQ